MDKVSIKVEFTRQVNGNNFTDSLYFTPEEYEAMSEKELEAKKQERVDNFQAFIDNPPEPAEPTKEELEQSKETLAAELERLNEKIQAKEAK